MAAKKTSTQAQIPAAYDPDSELYDLALDEKREIVRSRKLLNDEKEQQLRYGKTTPGTPQGEEDWGKVQDEDRKRRVISDVINRITQLERPEFYNAPESGTVLPIKPGMERFSEETGIYRTAPELPGTVPGGFGVKGKGHLGAFSNIGSDAGPSPAETDEGRAKLVGMKEELGVLGYRGKEAAQKATVDRELPEQRLIREQANKLQDQVKALKPSVFFDAAEYRAKVKEIQDEIGNLNTQYGELEATRKKKVSESTVTKKPWVYGTAEERAAKAPAKEPQAKWSQTHENRRLKDAGMPREGMVAVNDKTGEKVVFQGGKWTPTGNIPKTRMTVGSMGIPLPTQPGRAEAAIPPATPARRPIPEPVEVPRPQPEAYTGEGATLMGNRSPIYSALEAVKEPVKQVAETMKQPGLFTGEQKPTQAKTPTGTEDQRRNQFIRLVAAHDEAVKVRDLVMAERIRRKIKTDYPELAKTVGF